MHHTLQELVLSDNRVRSLPMGIFASAAVLSLLVADNAGVEAVPLIARYPPFMYMQGQPCPSCDCFSTSSCFVVPLVCDLHTVLAFVFHGFALSTVVESARLVHYRFNRVHAL